MHSTAVSMCIIMRLVSPFHVCFAMQQSKTLSHADLYQSLWSMFTSATLDAAEMGFAAAATIVKARMYLLQVKDSAMLSKIQGMVGTASPLGATVAQIRDRLTAVTR